jgi:hypothetical protein
VERRDESCDKVVERCGCVEEIACWRVRRALIARGKPTSVLAFRHASRMRRAVASRSSSVWLVDVVLFERWFHNPPTSFSLWKARRRTVVRMYHRDEEEPGDSAASARGNILSSLEKSTF